MPRQDDMRSPNSQRFLMLEKPSNVELQLHTHETVAQTQRLSMLENSGPETSKMWNPTTGEGMPLNLASGSGVAFSFVDPSSLLPKPKALTRCLLSVLLYAS